MGVYGRIVTLSSDGYFVSDMMVSEESGWKVCHGIACVLDEIQLGKARLDLGRNRAEQNTRRAKGKGFDVPREIGAVKHKCLMTKNRQGSAVAVTGNDGAACFGAENVGHNIRKQTFEYLEEACVAIPNRVHIVIGTDAEIEIVIPILPPVAGFQEDKKSSVFLDNIKACRVFGGGVGARQAL